MNNFASWYDRQEGVIKAAVITGIIAIVSVFVTGCFTQISAFIIRPSTPTPVTPQPTGITNQTPTPS